MLKTALRWLLAVFFVIAGEAHLARPAVYLAIMPGYLPCPRQLIYWSGLAEILGGFGVLIPRTRRWAGWGLTALLAAVFPANIHMLTHQTPVAGMHPPVWLLWARLPLQAVLVAWVLWITNPEDHSKPKPGLLG